jgi:membrane protease YdiL (CAAX protease family)
MRPAAALFVAIATLLVATTSYFAFSRAASGTPLFWILAAGPSLALGVVAAMWAARQEVLVSWLSPQWGDISRGIGGAAVLFAAALAFTRVVAPVGSPREIWIAVLYGQIGDPRLTAHSPAIAALIVATAVAEEVVWRGMVTLLLAERVGSRLAWLAAAPLYALAYVPTAWSLRVGSTLNPVLVLAALAGGLVWGALARAFGSLVPAMVAHAFFDWAVIGMFPLWGRALTGV